MILINKKSFVALANIFCVVSGFNVYILEDEVTTQNTNADMNATQIEDAHLLEVSEIETERFRYKEKQISGLDMPWERCYDDLNRCLLASISNPRPVCAFNRLDKREYGYCEGEYDLRYCYKRTFRSHCDAYFDNCRRGYRYWRILDTGYCDFKAVKQPEFIWGYEYFNIKNT